MSKFDFEAWVTEQASRIETAVRDAAREGTASSIAAWVVPSAMSDLGKPGFLHIGMSAPFHGADIVRLGHHGTTLAHCPYPHIRSLLWTAARSYPILPITAQAA